MKQLRPDARVYQKEGSDGIKQKQKRAGGTSSQVQSHSWENEHQEKALERTIY